MHSPSFARTFVLLFIGVLALLLGAQFTWGFWGVEPLYSVLGSLLCLGAVVWIRLVLLADRVRRFQASAIRSLRMPSDWFLLRNKILPDGTPVSVMLVRENGDRFPLEIFSFKGMQSRKDYRGRDTGEWIQSGGASIGRVAKQSMAELIRASEVLGTPAVVWLPKAPSGRNARLLNGRLIVVTGSPRHLVYAIRAIASANTDEQTSTLESLLNEEPPAPKRKRRSSRSSSRRDAVRAAKPAGAQTLLGAAAAQATPAARRQAAQPPAPGVVHLLPVLKHELDKNALRRVSSRLAREEGVRLRA
jgi:hypothetical protein